MCVDDDDDDDDDADDADAAFDIVNDGGDVLSDTSACMVRAVAYVWAHFNITRFMLLL